MARLSPVLPLIGADSKFQPVYVDDVAKVAELAVLGRASGGIYELGGPDVASFKSLMERMLTVIQRKSILLPLPFFLGRLIASAFDTLQSVSLGLLKNSLVTRDQIKNLARDNVVSGEHKTFADLGIEPTALDAVLADYLCVTARQDNLQPSRTLQRICAQLLILSESSKIAKLPLLSLLVLV